MLRRSMLAFALLLAAAPLSAAPSTASAADQQVASLPPHATIDIIETLAARGFHDIRAISFDRGSNAYAVTMRDGSGKVRDFHVDPVTATLSPRERDTIYSNIIDPQLFDSLRASFADLLPDGALPADEVARKLMASGDWQDIHSLKVEDGAYRAVMRGRDGRLSRLVIDPLTGTSYQPKS